MQCFLSLFQSTYVFLKLIHKLNKIYLPVNYRQMPRETEKMTGSCWSPIVICSTVNRKEKN